MPSPQVKGEVFLVDEPMLSQLDILENHPTYYRSIFKQHLMIHCVFTVTHWNGLLIELACATQQLQKNLLIWNAFCVKICLIYFQSVSGWNKPTCLDHSIDSFSDYAGLFQGKEDDPRWLLSPAQLTILMLAKMPERLKQVAAASKPFLIYCIF